MRRAALLAALVLLAAAAPAAASTPARNWVTAWAMAPQDVGPLATLVPFDADIGGRTIRDVVHPTVAGSALRIRLSNTFGTRPLTFDDVRVALRAHGAALVPGTTRRVRFAGRTPVTIPVGRQVRSDTVALRLPAGRDVAISLHSAGPTGRATVGGSLLHTSWLSAPGDVTTEGSGGAFALHPLAVYFATGLEVAAPRRVAGTLVAFGDSIVAGQGSTPDAGRSWVDGLARRLARRRHRPLAVVNEGISGNNLHQSTPCFGQSGIRRLDRDALGQTGVRDVILSLGANDITHPEQPRSSPFFECLARRKVSAARMIALYEQVIRRVHARGVRIVGVTITPFADYAYWSPAIERKREAINHWIRHAHAFDGVIDFARILGDPGHPARMRPAYASPDRLHPNERGYAAMARAIDLGLF